MPYRHAVVMDIHLALAVGASGRACLPCAGEWLNQAPALRVKPEGVAPEVLTRTVDPGILCVGQVCLVSLLCLVTKMEPDGMPFLQLLR